MLNSMESGAERLRRLLDEAEASRLQFENEAAFMAALSAVADEMVAQLTATQNRAIRDAQLALDRFAANRADAALYAAAKQAHEHANEVTNQVEAVLQSLLRTIMQAANAGISALRELVQSNEALLAIPTLGQSS